MVTDIASVHEGVRHRVKDREKSQVYQEISNFAPCSRKSIAAKLGLRPTTVSSVVAELLADGLVRETEERSSDRRGRPQVLLRPCFNRLTAISMYLQSRELHAALVNIGEEVLAEHVVILDAGIGNEEFLKACADSARRLLRDLPEDAEMLGIAVSLVGTVDSEAKTWVSAARWRRISQVGLRALEKRLRLPVVVNRMQDAELGYLVQKTRGWRAKGVLFVHWGFGIGASYAQNGHVLNSRIGRFCELGHTRVSLASRRQCQCGAYGCLETEAALWALQDDMRALVGPDVQSESALAVALADMDLLRVAFVRNALEHLKLGLLNVLEILFPDVIVFNGPFTENRRLFSELSRFLKAELPPYARDAVELRAVSGGFRGCISGNVYAFFRKRLREMLRVGCARPSRVPVRAARPSGRSGRSSGSRVRA